METPTLTPTTSSTPASGNASAPTGDPWSAAFTEAKGEATNLDQAEQTEEKPIVKASEEKMSLADLEGPEPTPKAAEEKEEAETEETTEKVEETEEESDKEVKAEEAKTDPAKGPARRDYSFLAEADRPAAKHMSNDAFRLLERTVKGKDAVIAEQAEKLKEVGDGKTLPDAWYNDPAAAEATPEYRAIKTEFDKAQVETHKLTALLVKYKSGQIKYNPTTGGFVVNDDGTPKDEAIEQQLADGRQQMWEKAKELANQGNAVVGNFGKVYKQAETQVMSSAKNLFPWMADPKNENNKHMAELLKEWPKVFRGHPATQFATALGVSFMQLKLAYQNVKAQLEGKAAAKVDQRKSASNITRNGSRSGTSTADTDKKMTLADFDV